MASLYRRLRCVLPLCLVVLTGTLRAEEQPVEYPLTLRVLQTEQVPYSEQISGGSATDSCWFARSGSTLRMSCSRTEIPPMYWPKTLQVMLVEGSDGNAYILSCRRSSRWSKCRYLGVGVTLQARWKDHDLAVGYAAGKKNKAQEATYQVLRSAVLEDRTMADLQRGLRAEDEADTSAPPGDMNASNEGGSSSAPGDRRIKSLWPEQKQSPSAGAIGVTGRDGPQGVILTGVTPGGPADQAGLRAGDIITAVDGKPFTKVTPLGAEIQGRVPGSVARITYLRGDLRIETQLTVAAAAVK